MKGRGVKLTLSRKNYLQKAQPNILGLKTGLLKVIRCEQLLEIRENTFQ